MWFSEANEFLDMFKGFVPYYLLIALPLMIIISPVNPVAASHEFPAHRMQQFDLHGVPHGCRAAPVSLEGRGLNNWATARHCVMARLQDLTIEQFREIRSRAGALLVVLPKDASKLSSAEKQMLLSLEAGMLQHETFIPVYFSHWSPELEAIIEDVHMSAPNFGPQGTAAEVLMSQVAANGYQIVIGASSASPRSDVMISTIHGKLIGNGLEDKLPNIVVVAHYDSFGIAPDLAMGANSNAAGVAMVLELARLMSSLYADARTHARYNLIFLLSGAGKMNFQGSKKWLEDQIDGVEGGLPQDGTYVLCLDSVGGAGPLHLHVSKPPKEGTVGDRVWHELSAVAEQEQPATSVQLIHKKINLAEETLAWEHERFSMKRLAAATLSTLKSHRDLYRSSILDTKDDLDVTYLARNTRVVAEALTRHIFGLSSGRVFSSQLGVEKDSLQMWIDYLASQPRSPQLLAHKNNALVNTLKETMTKYLKNVKVTPMVPDKRDPELVFYDATKAVVNIYNVKPAVFDLILTIAIVLYLAVVYVIVQKFPTLYGVASTIVGVKKSKVY